MKLLYIILNKSSQFVKRGEYVFFGKKPLLIQEEESRGQGLKATARLHFRSFNFLLYFKGSFMSKFGDYLIFQ